MVKSGCHIPVNVPDIISVLVFPNLRKGHTPSLKSTVVLTGKNLPGKPTGLDLDFPYFL